MNVHSVSSEASDASNAATQRCECCGAAFHCGALAGDATCWCAALAHLPADSLRPDASSCLCPVCLAAKIAGVMPQTLSKRI
jgi:hypothetical protein